MPKFESLEAFIRERYKTQGKLAEKLGIAQNTVSAWLTGKNRVSPEMEQRLRDLKYDGPLPHQAAQEAPAPAGGPYVTEKDGAKLEARIEALEKRCREYDEALWYLKLRLKEDLNLDLEKEK